MTEFGSWKSRLITLLLTCHAECEMVLIIVLRSGALWRSEDNLVDFRWDELLLAIQHLVCSLSELYAIDEEVFFRVTLTFLDGEAHQFEILVDGVNSLGVAALGTVQIL